MDLDRFSGKKICVAVSGGVDSMTLLHYMRSRAAECGYILLAVHCEHGIRGEESVSDARFVAETCEKWGIPLFSFAEDCPQKAAREKMSLETAAREFRYEAFRGLLDRNQADLIALAHHLDDEAETVLFRLARGTSLTGAQGMKEIVGRFIRPLLTWTRADILAYARENGVLWREDGTNFQMDATRNKLRLEVLPVLEAAVPGAAKNLARFARLAQEDDAFLYSLAEKLLLPAKDGERITVSFSEERPLFYRAALMAMKALGVDRDYTQQHLESVFALQGLERGATVCLPKALVAEKTVDGVSFGRKTTDQFLPKSPSEKFGENGFDGGRYAVSIENAPPPVSENAWKILYFDGDKLPADAVFRFRKEGDTIRSFGGKKTLKKFFNEKKTPVAEREYLPLIASEDGAEVYAVCGVEISERIKVDEKTKRTLYVVTRKK